MIFYEYEYVCIPTSKYFRIHKSAYDYDCIRTSKRDYKCIYDISASRRPPNKEIYSTPPITRNSVSDKTQIVVHSTLNLP